MENLELFVLYFHDDPSDDTLITDELFLLYDKTKISIGQIMHELDKHRKICEEDNITYNKILALRKLQTIGLEQVMSYIKDIGVDSKNE